jgi:hypothetical protein
MFQRDREEDFGVSSSPLRVSSMDARDRKDVEHWLEESDGRVGGLTGGSRVNPGAPIVSGDQMATLETAKGARRKELDYLEVSEVTTPHEFPRDLYIVKHRSGGEEEEEEEEEEVEEGESQDYKHREMKVEVPVLYKQHEMEEVESANNLSADSECGDEDVVIHGGGVEGGGGASKVLEGGSKEVFGEGGSGEWGFGDVGGNGETRDEGLPQGAGGQFQPQGGKQFRPQGGGGQFQLQGTDGAFQPLGASGSFQPLGYVREPLQGQEYGGQQGTSVVGKPLQTPSAVELKTLVFCTTQLEMAFAGADRELIHFLYCENFISDSVRDTVLNPRSLLSDREKAGELVKGVKKKVKEDPRNYYTLINKLKQNQSAYYKPLLGTLEAEYECQQREVEAEALQIDMKERESLLAAGEGHIEASTGDGGIPKVTVLSESSSSDLERKNSPDEGARPAPSGRKREMKRKKRRRRRTHSLTEASSSVPEPTPGPSTRSELLNVPGSAGSSTVSQSKHLALSELESIIPASQGVLPTTLSASSPGNSHSAPIKGNIEPGLGGNISPSPSDSLVMTTLKRPALNPSSKITPLDSTGSEDPSSASIAVLSTSEVPTGEASLSISSIPRPLDLPMGVKVLNSRRLLPGGDVGKGQSTNPPAKMTLEFPVLKQGSVMEYFPKEDEGSFTMANDREVCVGDRRG